MTSSHIPRAIYLRIKKAYGETTANLYAWGTGALIGADFSASTDLLQLPYGRNIAERFGNLLLPPGLDLIARNAAAAGETEGPRQPSSGRRLLESTLHNTPILRWLVGWQKISDKLRGPVTFGQAARDALTGSGETGFYDFSTPGGKLEFQLDLQDVLRWSLGFRTLPQAKQSLLLDGTTSIHEARDATINKATGDMFDFIQSGDVEDLRKAEHKLAVWQEYWGTEARIDMSEVATRLTRRIAAADKDKVGRILDGLPAAFRMMELGVREEMLDAISAETGVPRDPGARPAPAERSP